MPPRGRLKAIRRKSGAVVRVGVDLLHSVADAIPVPAVKGVAGGLHAVISRADVCKANKAAARQARSEGERQTQRFLEYLETHDLPQELIHKLYKHVEDLNDIAEKIPDLDHVNWSLRALHAEQNARGIAGANSDLQRICNDAQMDILMYGGRPLPGPTVPAAVPCIHEHCPHKDILGFRLRNFHILAGVLFRC
ncbi:hypothetical protein EXIGLDRAFT_80140 [Exidia glandulosa HHB12029]|uniref:Uncharacterized protein n=1 Tax=Exidia glandulosa HHB12029 TaxID=1314781 RepID=A0A165HNJ4_EXIGL|nr:hypothetical protein EXIGLDRAFT_80140 [Exidia glandulosa HHB12029]